MRPDVSIPTTWQQLSELIRADNIASMVEHDDVPLLSQRMTFGQQQPPATGLSLPDIPLTIQSDVSQADFTDDLSLLDPSDSLDVPAAPPEPSLPTEAGTSSRGRVCTMSQAMAKSVSQRNFYGCGNMHYMAAKSVCEHDYSADHDSHLELQEGMHHPIAFLAELMGDIMYLHQALRQPDSRELMEAVIKEVNGHVERKHWAIVKQDTVPEDIEVLPSVWSMRRQMRSHHRCHRETQGQTQPTWW
jgi:hypothetical protein